MTLFTKILIATPLVLLSFVGESNAQFGRGGRGGYGGGYYGGGYGGGGYGYGSPYGYGGSGINYSTKLGNSGFLSVGTGNGYGGSGISYGTRVGNNGFLSVGTGFNNGYGNSYYGNGYGYGNSYYGNGYSSGYSTPYYGNSYYSNGVMVSPSYAPTTSFYSPSGTVMSGSTLQAMPAAGVVQVGATAPASAAGKYTVVVPDKAKVWFNGAMNNQTGTRRDFTSTGSGQLTIKVEWKNGDQQMSKEMMVNVQEGEQSTLDLTPLLN